MIVLDTVSSVRYICLHSYHYLFSILISLYLSTSTMYIITQWGFFVYFIHPVHEYRVLLFIL